MIDIAKLCVDFLRVHLSSTYGIKLKPTHGHEIVAAFFGYKSRAALLAEKHNPLSQLDEAAVLVPDYPLIESRRGDLGGLPPGLPATRELIDLLVEFLTTGAYFFGKAWVYDSFEGYITDEYLREEDALIMDLLSGVMAETNAYFDEAVFDDVEVLDDPSGITVVVTGQYCGTSDPDRMFCGDTIDMKLTIEMARIAGRTGFGEPDLSAGGEVNDDWVDPELKYGVTS